MVATAAYRDIIAISHSFTILFGGACPLPQPCVPTVTIALKTFGLAAQLVLSYLDRNPDKRNLAAAALVVAAMDEAWCPQTPAAPSAHYKGR
jgi:hypothetical protein